jgi:alkanesulfonate monooxygenase SsuD/methylene tetrahydromethanopterin reductase-like flavin-dependent oxidoreductase (luciferase family)
METGLLWYDDSKADFASKVREAAQRYRQKFGKNPDRCYVNPASLPKKGKGVSLKGIKVVTSPTIQPHHFWVGVGSGKRSQTR